MTLIEKEPIMEFIQKGLNEKHYGHVGVEIITEVEYAPTIDAVPVVRCKDCVHSAKLEGYHQRRLENGLNCNACRGENGYGIAKLSLTTPDGYCDYGLRRSSEAE